MMSGKLKQHWSFIDLMITTNASQRLALLKTITDNQLAVLCEIVLNTLHGHLYVPPTTVKSLKRHKLLLRRLASRDISKSKKKKLIFKNHRLITNVLMAVHALLETYMKS